MNNKSLIHKDQVYKIVGACMEVHNKLGCGFLEAIYQEALEKEFKWRNISYEREKELKVHYKTIILNKRYIADFICYGEIILELKASKENNDVFMAQVINYLKATGFKLALLVNFGKTRLEYQRIVL